MNLSRRQRDVRLLAVALFCIAAVWVSEELFTGIREHPDSRRMRRAAAVAADWMKIAGAAKRTELNDAGDKLPQDETVLLGKELTPITTTQGSVEAKLLSLNPRWAALITRLLGERGVDSSTSVGLVISGSFPGLAISALAALRTLGADPVILSSLGASSYGANEPLATWIDIERWLEKSGIDGVRSDLVTYGAEGDSGGGLDEEGIAALQESAVRCGVDIMVPGSLVESIEKKLDILLSRRIEILVNIGGNHASLGGCVHGSAIPTGLQEKLPLCRDPDRGLLVRVSELGIPVLHILNIRDLALRYGISDVGPPFLDENEPVYLIREPQTAVLLAIFVCILLGIVWVRRGGRLRRGSGEHVLHRE